LVLAALLVRSSCLHADTAAPPAKAAVATGTLQVDARPVVSPKADYAIRLFHSGHFLPPTMEVPNGFTDGGRQMKVHPDGRLTSHRELIEVDRKRDAFLRGYIEHVRGKEYMDLDPADRAGRIGLYVDTLMSSRGGRRAAEPQWEKLEAEYANRGLLLGEIAGITGTGVCRHRTLLYKILANAAGLKVSVVRGCYQHRDGHVGGHAWNELYLDDGSVFLVDTMNPPRGWKFPSIKQPIAQKYLSVARKPLYEGGKVPWAPVTGLPVSERAAKYTPNGS
jgi:hypothetical protein